MVPNKLTKILYNENITEDHKNEKTHNHKRISHQTYPFPANVLPSITSSSLAFLFTGKLVQIT
jgi:hypothetical protein